MGSEGGTQVFTLVGEVCSGISVLTHIFKENGSHGFMVHAHPGFKAQAAFVGPNDPPLWEWSAIFVKVWLSPLTPGGISHSHHVTYHSHSVWGRDWEGQRHKSPLFPLILPDQT